jgi:Tfp pilus assembly protein PilV
MSRLSKASEAGATKMINRRSGLTMLEVIFSMVVILVGLVSIAFLIPLAGRQAEDSQQITQGLAAGDSALALFNTANIAQPTLESPWCLIDDVGVTEYSVSGMKDSYNAVGSSFPVPQNATQAAVAQNESIGIGFCIDPLFWGFANRSGNNVPQPFFRTRFPFLFDNSDPVLLVSDPQLRRAPRLLRGSLSDPQLSMPGSWLRQPAAVRLATMYGGDLIQPSSTKNKAIGPLRSVYVGTDGAIISTPNAAAQASWLATITPSEDTPIISLDRVTNIFQQSVLANQPLDIPRLYDVALVVFSKRDVRELSSVAVISPGNAQQGTPSEVMNVPTNERAVRVTGISDDAITSGTFNVVVNGYATMDSKIKPGDWMMMSRFAMRDLTPRPANNANVTQVARQVHRWYRIISVTGDSYPLTLRVAGKPWGWTEGEISDMQEKGMALPTVPPVPGTGAGTYETQAVILKDVVQVYERQMELR